MFGNRETQRHKAERVAGQAWNHLASAVDSAESSARSARRRAGSMFDDTSQRIGTSAKEARKRANHAYDALLGRPQRGTSWGWIATAAAAGLAVGWVATMVSRRALEGPEPLTLESLPDGLLTARTRS